MTGLEVFLPMIIKEVVGAVTDSPETAQQVAQMATDNPEMAMLATGSPVMVVVLLVIRWFFKTPDKLLKFRRGFDKVAAAVVAVGAGMMKFSKYMKKKRVGGVCELPPEDESK